METLWNDVRYGLRLLAKSPAFTAVAMLTLALGIGANTAIFTIINSVMWNLPYAHPRELVAVANSYPESGLTPSSFPDFIEWRQQARSFQGLAATFANSFTVLGKGEPRRIPGAYISDGYFSLLGIAPVLGRNLNAEEHRPGGAPACLISREFWQREFGGSGDVLGKSLALNGREYTIVGVMPAAAPGFFSSREVWIPLEPSPPWNQHGTNYLRVLGRLKPGVTVEGARQDLAAIQERINAQFPPNKHGIEAGLLETALFGDIRPILLVLFAAVAFVLLIGCVNLANMLLARGTARAREFAIRRSLGATRAALVRQALTESLLVSLLGGAAGILLAVAAAKALIPYLPSNLRPEHVGMDLRVLLFTLVTSMVAGMAFGLMPALRVSRGNARISLQEGSQQAGEARGQHRLRSVLVGAEIALATVLVSGATLTIASLYRVLHMNPGFNPQGLVRMQIPLSSVRYPDAPSQLRFFQSLIARIRALPGVQSASATAFVPFGEGGQTGDFNYEGHEPFQSGQGPFAAEHFAFPDYFSTMQIPLLRGRTFTERDATGAPKVAVINESMARKLWPGQDPIGKRVQILGDWQEVIGVVADVRADRLTLPAGLQAYLCALQYTPSDMAIVIRAAGDPFAAVTAAKNAVYALDPQQPVSHVTLLNELIADSLTGVRAPTVLLGVFGSLAMLLASIGVYGVTAYSVSRRYREFGIRLALGARPADIIRLVVRSDLRVAGIGLAIGILASVPLGGFLRNLLFGVADADPAASLAAAGFLAAVAALATYLPARRAARVDPLVALRYE
jgi:putative ABC transport system permease protein